MWVSTFSGGLSYFDQRSTDISQLTHQLNHPNSLGNDNVNKILEDSRGNIWFATNNGVSCWNVAETVGAPITKTCKIRLKFFSHCEDNNGNI